MPFWIVLRYDPKSNYLFILIVMLTVQLLKIGANWLDRRLTVVVLLVLLLFVRSSLDI